MNLEQTPESIVPEQTVIDSWPTKVRIASHPCQDKCSDFQEEQCGHCLVQEQSNHPPILKNMDEAKFYGQALIAEKYIP